MIVVMPVVVGALVAILAVGLFVLGRWKVKSSKITSSNLSTDVRRCFSLEEMKAATKTYITTIVKGSFGYLDPEYYRRQQLTEKSDVYSFGVVLCEVLCGRPPLMRTTDKKKAYIVEWVRRCNRENIVAQIIDPNIVNDISPKCLGKFVEIVMSCTKDDGLNRPSMKDVVWGLEFALQLQESSKKKRGGDEIGYNDREMDSDEEGWLMEEASSDVTTTNSEDSSCSYNKGISDNLCNNLGV